MANREGSATSDADEIPTRAVLGRAEVDLLEDHETPSQDDEEQAFISDMRDRWQIHVAFWSPIHAAGLEDDLFVAGKQWPDTIAAERRDQDRPMLTYNLFPSFCRQITNAVRQERPQLKVTPVETGGKKPAKMGNLAGSKDYNTADVLSGLIRNIEHVSRADQAYDTALKHAVDHGFGYFRLTNEWSRDNPFVQELVIKRVKDSFAVTLGPEAQEADYRDTPDAFVFEWIDKTTFEKRWPGKNPSDFASGLVGQMMTNWWNNTGVRVAEYYRIEYFDDHVLQMSNGMLLWESEVKDVLDEMEAETGLHVALDEDGEKMRKMVKRPQCVWRRVTASHVLEGPIKLPFSAVPIFPVLGEELIVDGVTMYESAIRHAKDAQRSYNYWRTAMAETIALQPRAPVILSSRQIVGHESMWEAANRENQPYLVYNHVEGHAMPNRLSPPIPPTAEALQARQDGEDMQSIIGLHDANLGKVSNEKSGRAIIARQNAGATSTFQFPDNLGRAIEQMGRLMVEAIPKLWDTNRILRVRLPDGGEDFVEINKSVYDETTKKTSLVSDIGIGKYDVVLETGPSYATQRQEAADLQMELLKSLGPERAQNIVHLIVKNLGVPGSEEVSAVLRKMLPEQLKSEEEKLADLPKGVSKGEDGQLMKDGQPWQPEPTPEMIMAQKAQELEGAKIEALMAKAQAETATANADKIQAEAKIAEAQAKQAQIGAEYDAAAAQAGQPNMEQNAQMMAGIEEIVRRVIEEHEANPKAHEEPTEAAIADVTVDILKRVKVYVDKQMQTLKAQTAASPSVTAPAAPATPAAPASSPAGRGSMTSSVTVQPAPPVVVNLHDRRPDRVAFEYGTDGQVVAGVPVYDDEKEETNEPARNG